MVQIDRHIEVQKTNGRNSIDTDGQIEFLNGQIEKHPEIQIIKYRKKIKCKRTI